MARVRVPIAVIDPAGNAVAGASVTVNKRSTGIAATLYVAETGPTTTANPTATDAYGRVTAWVDRGAYNAVISGTGITTYTQPFEAGAAADQAIDDLWLPYGATAPVVAALPAGVDGQEITYAVDPTNGVYWHFKYVAAITGSYKWAFVGGAPLVAEVDTSEATASTSYVSLATAGPSVTAPLAGDYMLEIANNASNNTAGFGAYSTWWIAGLFAPTAPGNIDDAVAVSAGANNQYTVRRRRRKNGIAAGSLVQAKYAADSNTATFSYRSISILPIRVG